MGYSFGSLPCRHLAGVRKRDRFLEGGVALDHFLIQRFMGFFWIATQQILFCGVKYAYDTIARKGGAKLKLLVGANIAFFVFFAYVCFERELGFWVFWGSLITTTRYNLYQWGMCIFVCSSMILFDVLIALYIYRIVRVVRKGLAAARPTFAGDVVAGGIVALLGATYYFDSVRASLALGFSMDEYFWIGRFFIQVSNFFYAAFETFSAVMFLTLLKKLKERKGAL